MKSKKKTKNISTDTNCENLDKRKMIDEISGILKDKLDEELWRTVIKKVEKIAYSGYERTESDNIEVKYWFVAKQYLSFFTKDLI